MSTTPTQDVSDPNKETEGPLNQSGEVEGSHVNHSSHSLFMWKEIEKAKT